MEGLVNESWSDGGDFARGHEVREASGQTRADHEGNEWRKEIGKTVLR
jgi:hypothetical protein